MIKFMRNSFPFFAVLFTISTAFAFTACKVDRVPAKITGVECTSRDGGADCLWFEPDNGDYQIVDYIVKYKLAADSTYSTYSDGISTDTAVSFESLTNGQSYNVQVYARNKYGDSPASDAVTFTPNGTVGGLDDVLASVVSCWQSDVYSGSGDWLNQISSPADGSAQSAYDVTPSNTALYSSGKWTMNNVDNFNIGTNTTFINNLHKTTGGVDFTLLARLKTTSPVTVDTILGTADDNGNYGIVWRADSGGALKLDQYDGVTRITQAAGAFLSTNTVYNLAVKRDTTAGQLGWAINSDTWETESDGWTGSVSSNATYPLKIASEGNGGSDMDSGVELYAVCLLNDDLTDAQLAAANDWMDANFPTAAATAPDAPVSLVTMPSDTQVFLAWDLWDDGGAAVTDYVIQSDCGSGYSTFSDGTSTNKYATVTGLTNGTECDFHVAAVNSAGTSSYSTSRAATPAAEGTNPYDETDYKLTLPVNSSGERTGSAAEITSGIGTYESAWFGRVNSQFKFNCVYPAATTATATYSRSEFRGLYNGKEFNFDDDSDETLKFSVDECPTSAGNTKVIVEQIHDADEPIYKVNYDCRAGTGNDTLRVLYKVCDGCADTTTTIKTGITRGDQIKLRVFYDGDGSSHSGQQTADFYVDDVLVLSQASNRTGANDPMYRKRGDYCQLGPAGALTSVTHYAP